MPPNDATSSTARFKSKPVTGVPKSFVDWVSPRKGRSFSIGLLEDIQQKFQRIYPLIRSTQDLAADTGRILINEVDRIGQQELRVGIIQQSFPLYGYYKVALFGGGIVQCRAATPNAGLPGARDTSCYQHGLQVLVAISPQTMLGTIICASPEINNRPGTYFCHSLVQGSGVGALSSGQYTQPISATQDSNGALTFSGDRSYDALPGDFSVTTPTGLALHIDDEMMLFRVSEICGLNLFREDGHTRLSGEQLRLESLSTLHESGINEYELYSYSGYAYYPWELLGNLTGQPLDIEENDKNAILKSGSGVYEPVDKIATPITRLEVYHGYIGQGRLTQLFTPLSTNNGSQPDSRGLFREQILLDGSYVLESSRLVCIAKTFDVPVLKQLKEPGVPVESTSYAQSGGSSRDDAAYSIKTFTEAVGDDQALHALDIYAYTAGWQGMHAAVYSDNYEFIEASGSSQASQNVFTFDSGRISPNVVQKETIDHRYDQVDIHKILSLFAILPNGDVVIQNGQGAALKLAQGRVEIEAASMTVHTAQDFNILSRRISLNGYKSAEITSAKGSLYIKGDKNVMLLAGNSGSGTLLLENRGSGLTTDWQKDPENISGGGGIIIKSSLGYITAVGQDIALKTGSGATGASLGDIVIDAGNGKCVIKALEHHRYSSLSYYDHFASQEGEVVGSNRWTQFTSELSSPLNINGSVAINGGIKATGNYSTSLGHFYSTLARTVDRVLPERNASSIDDEITQLNERLTTAKEKGTATNDSLRDKLAGEKRPLNPEQISKTSFGFPSTQSLQLERFYINEPIWKNTITGTESWDEPVVNYQGEPTRPWPGQHCWNRDDSFRTRDPEATGRYFDLVNQSPVSPQQNQELYNQALAPSTKPTTMLGNVKVCP